MQYNVVKLIFIMFDIDVVLVEFYKNSYSKIYT